MFKWENFLKKEGDFEIYNRQRRKFSHQKEEDFLILSKYTLFLDTWLQKDGVPPKVGELWYLLFCLMYTKLYLTKFSESKSESINIVLHKYLFEC